jgi:hypothetical protein
MSKSHHTVESLQNVAADHELVGDLALDRETRRRNSLGARKVRKLADRLANKRDLVRLERNIALGGQRISRQKGLIARIERLGADSSRARELLSVFEQTQAVFEQYRERLLRKARPHRDGTAR